MTSDGERQDADDLDKEQAAVRVERAVTGLTQRMTIDGGRVESISESWG